MSFLPVRVEQSTKQLLQYVTVNYFTYQPVKSIGQWLLDGVKAWFDRMVCLPKKRIGRALQCRSNGGGGRAVQGQAVISPYGPMDGGGGGGGVPMLNVFS